MIKLITMYFFLSIVTSFAVPIILLSKLGENCEPMIYSQVLALMNGIEYKNENGKNNHVVIRKATTIEEMREIANEIDVMLLTNNSPYLQSLRPNSCFYYFKHENDDPEDTLKHISFYYIVNKTNNSLNNVFKGENITWKMMVFLKVMLALKDFHLTKFSNNRVKSTNIFMVEANSSKRVTPRLTDFRESIRAEGYDYDNPDTDFLPETNIQEVNYTQDFNQLGDLLWEISIKQNNPLCNKTKGQTEFDDYYCLLLKDYAQSLNKYNNNDPNDLQTFIDDFINLMYKVNEYGKDKRAAFNQEIKTLNNLLSAQKEEDLDIIDTIFSIEKKDKNEQVQKNIASYKNQINIAKKNLTFLPTPLNDYILKEKGIIESLYQNADPIRTAFTALTQLILSKKQMII